MAINNYGSRAGHLRVVHGYTLFAEIASRALIINTLNTLRQKTTESKSRKDYSGITWGKVAKNRVDFKIINRSCEPLTR